ncbi:MAG: beta-lactamase family protein, partial [Deltaproteobacteria bacterium]|nr:beta-lactamase family protein [Deltaproteobacteria bacterium]
MKPHPILCALLFATTLACGTRVPPPATPAKASKKTPKVETKTTLALKIEAPQGFTKRTAGPTTFIAGPDPALRVVVMVSQVASLEAAIVTGWTQTDPGHTIKPKSVIRPPTANEPYDKSIIAHYEIGTDQIVRQAIAHRYKEQAIVILLRGPLSEVKKRSAQLREIMGSVKPMEATTKTLSAADAKELSMAQLEELRAFVEKARATLEVPGAALAVVQDGNVLFSEGFGHTDLKGKRKVTSRTQMMLGSITKSFTALLVAKLVAEGKLSWETAVTKLDPSFRLKSKKQTDALKLWHLMCACTGVPRRDMPLIFDWEKATPESVMGDLRQLELLTGFGETFQYSNQLVASAGFVVAKAAGKGRNLATRYRRLLRSKVLAPLKMKDTRLSFAAVTRRGKHAMPHSETIGGKLVTLPLAHERFVLPYAPAGALWSSVDDFSKLLVELTQKESKVLPPREQL